MSGKASPKADLRSRVRELLDKLPEAKREAQSEKIREQLRFPPGARVAIFAGTNREPDLLPLIARYPEVLWSLPKVTGPGEMKFLRVNETSSLSPGAYGILESDTGEVEEEIEIYLCPGVAFTEQGRRLGQGGGFYDRYLSRFPDAGKIGICFREQLLDDLPGEDHDIQMDRVITSSAAPSV